MGCGCDVKKIYGITFFCGDGRVEGGEARTHTHNTSEHCDLETELADSMKWVC